MNMEGETRMPCYEEQLIHVEGVTYEYGGGTGCLVMKSS